MNKLCRGIISNISNVTQMSRLTTTANEYHNDNNDELYIKHNYTYT